MNNYFLIYTVYVLILSLLMGVSTWKLYQKMGYHPLLAFVPFYNYYIILKETKHPKCWVIISYFPIVGPIMMSAFHVFLMRKFGKKSFMPLFLTVLLPFVYMARVNYTTKSEIEKEDEYSFPFEEGNIKKKETFFGSIVFAIVFATLIHTFITRPFGIPTGSMEKTLQVGDFLFVNNLNYGYRMPMRPLAIPFLQGTIYDAGEKGNPKDDPKSYVEAVKLPYFRFPGWEKPKRNDIIVFNYPEDSVHTAIDRKDPYVKRCVAIAGDVVEFRNGDLFVNGKPEVRMKDAEVQHAYDVVTDQMLDMDAIYKAYGFSPVIVKEMQDGKYLYSFSGLTDKVVKDFSSVQGVLSVNKLTKPKGEKDIAYYYNEQEGQFSNKINYSNTIFPSNKNWNTHWYGPLRIPKKGDVITLTKENYPEYQRLIEEYEGNKITFKDDKIFINNTLTNQYTVKYNYYMMIGDNRDASLDSRFFGYVPETHIIGKPMFTWLSIEGAFKDSNSMYQAQRKIRWDRMFKATNTGDTHKTSYWWLAAVIIILFFGWEYFARLFKKNKK